MVKYYYAGAEGVAERVQKTGSNQVFLLLGDHDRKGHDSGSTSISYDVSAQMAVTEKYKAWGELRDGVNNLPTDYTFTGQYSNSDDFGLMYYGARWYDQFWAASLRPTQPAGASPPLSRRRTSSLSTILHGAPATDCCPARRPSLSQR